LVAPKNFKKPQTIDNTGFFKISRNGTDPKNAKMDEWGSGGRWFKSSHSDQVKNPQTVDCQRFAGFLVFVAMCGLLCKLAID
jgi:hypothetical protein